MPSWLKGMYPHCTALSFLTIGSHSLRRRFVFMGMLNAIFAPFIVLYMIMYSFFRYFDVCIRAMLLWGETEPTFSSRNTAIILLQSAVDVIHHLHNGSSANSTNCLICSLVDWMSPTPWRIYTLGNSRMRRSQSSCGKCSIQGVSVC